jgi:hypothetical protein
VKNALLAHIMTHDFTHDFTHDTRLLTHDTRHIGTLMIELYRGGFACALPLATMTPLRSAGTNTNNMFLSSF